ncbi:MAG TPA: PAS domain-containing protein [Kofleriaceae bacterium]|nr:PAS domain-containing protein [Kofleriaceae bacterium]
MAEGRPEHDVLRPGTIRSFVRRARNEILAEWRRTARELPITRDMNAVVLVDHIPALLDEIAEIAEEIAGDKPPSSGFETARRHALDRLGEGFDIATVVRELSLLRGATLAVWARAGVDHDLAALRALDLAVDRAIAASVGRYAEAHERTLSGIDRISTASFQSTSIDELMQRLLAVFIETTPAVDTAAIFLAEGDRLRLRAAVGLEGELARGADVAIGEGFSGTIAARREPMELRSAYLDPRVDSEVIRERKVRALHGVPLIQNDRVIGVAHMGSITASEFSQEDRQFFGSMAARATLGIAHHMLRQELASSEERFKRIASERERALAKLESLLAAAPVGIGFVDRELRFLRINQALATINGRQVAEYIGRTVAEVLPAIASRLEPLLRRVLDSGEPAINLELTRPLPGTSRGTQSLLANYFPVRSPSGEITGVGAILIDVTEAKRAQEALRIEQLRIESILEHAPAAIWIKDHDGHVVLANDKLADALGHEFGRVIGRRSLDLLPEEIAAEHEANDDRVIREGRAIEVEETLPSPGGPRTFLSIKFPIPGDPPLIGGIATEITQRKQMEQELRDAVRTRENVLAIVSHDLRSPLGTVQLSATMLMSQLAADHRARRHLEMIHRSCLRMENLIDALLDTASIRAGRLQLAIRREPAEAVVAEAIDLQQPLAAERGIHLVRECELQGVDILCDRDRILQVLGNLLGNALKFCRPQDTITVRASRDGDHVAFSVADTGPGIPEDVMPHLFDAYWSGSEHATQGSGLGLYISRGIVEGHGGKIWVERGRTSGAELRFTLPIAK